VPSWEDSDLPATIAPVVPADRDQPTRVNQRPRPVPQPVAEIPRGGLGRQTGGAAPARSHRRAGPTQVLSQSQVKWRKWVQANAQDPGWWRHEVLDGAVDSWIEAARNVPQDLPELEALATPVLLQAEWSAPLASMHQELKRLRSGLVELAYFREATSPARTGDLWELVWDQANRAEELAAWAKRYREIATEDEWEGRLGRDLEETGAMVYLWALVAWIEAGPLAAEPPPAPPTLKAALGEARTEQALRLMQAYDSAATAALWCLGAGAASGAPAELVQAGAIQGCDPDGRFSLLRELVSRQTSKGGAPDLGRAARLAEEAVAALTGARLTGQDADGIGQGLARLTGGAP
jgi:hypothetical protein